MHATRAFIAAGIVALSVSPFGGAHAQARLTREDSATLATQPTRHLEIDGSVLHRLTLLAAGLDREVVLCLQGSVAGDTAKIGSFNMPDLLMSAAEEVVPQPCEGGTLAIWHNHVWMGPDSSFGLRSPPDLCSLSQPDIHSVIADSVPFAIVSVGKADRPVICWWRRVQVVINKRVHYLPRFPNQWSEPSLARQGGSGGQRISSPP
jgi:hypothetical protein